MAKRTDESDLAFAKLNAVSGMVVVTIEAQAEDRDEAFLMALTVLARFTRDIKPEYREQLLQRMADTLRVLWAADDKAHPVM